MVYYDITGRRSLAASAEEEAFSYSFCQVIMRETLDMMNRLEDHLLDPNSICFTPEYVFVEDNKLSWIYGHSPEESFQEKFEGLLSWILSKINYDDDNAVQFMYQIFWAVRKHGFSERLIEKILEQNAEERKIQSESYEEFFGEEEAPPEQEEPARNWLKGRNACFLMALVTVFVTGYFIVSGYLGGYSLTDQKIIGTGAVLALLFFTGTFICHRIDGREKRGQENGLRKETTRQEDDVLKELPSKQNSHSEAQPVQPEREMQEVHPFPDGQDAGATVILSAGSRHMPILKSLETGEVTLVKECPFYIGSDPIINQMILIDKTISRQHAVILKGRKKDHYEIRDLGSTNGTWLKGIPVNTDHADSLEDGDVVGFAQKKYRFIVRKDVL